MKKSRLAEIREKAGALNVKKRIDIKKDEIKQGQHQKQAQRFMPRWRELSGGNEIDWTNPVIELEYYMCSMPNLLRLSDPQLRDEQLAELSPEQRELYFKTGPGNSIPYCDVKLTPNLVKSVYKERQNRKKAMKQSGEWDEYTDEAIEKDMNADAKNTDGDSEN